MNKFYLLSIFFFIFSFIFFLVGFISGDIEGGIFVIFPFVKGSGIIGFLGVIFLFFTFVFFMFAFAFNFEKKVDDSIGQSFKTNSSKKFGGLVFIGPIPIIFGSNLKMILFTIILALCIILVYFIILHFY